MENFTERLQAIVDDTGLSVNALESKLEIGHGTLRKALLNGNPRVGLILILYKHYPNYCYGWLITGRGSMYAHNGHSRYGKREFEELEQQVNEMSEKLKKLTRERRDADKEDA